MSKPFFVTLKNRGMVRVTGADARTFLQGLVSNDMMRASAETSVYACLLTPQGKFLHDFFVTADGDALILDCEGGDRATDLCARLSKFKLRAKVTLDVDTNIPVYSIHGSGHGVADPRHPELGRRSFIKPELDERPFGIWDAHRISLCVPDGSRDMELEKSTLLECRIDRLNGIDWNKGCYMGQELTARMHYRGLAKKHLYVVDATSGMPLPPPFSDLPNGGQMRSSCDGTGLAVLKDDNLHTADYGFVRIKEAQPWA